MEISCEYGRERDRREMRAVIHAGAWVLVMAAIIIAALWK